MGMVKTLQKYVTEEEARQDIKTLPRNEVGGVDDIPAKCFQLCG